MSDLMSPWRSPLMYCEIFICTCAGDVSLVTPNGNVPVLRQLFPLRDLQMCSLFAKDLQAAEEKIIEK